MGPPLYDPEVGGGPQHDQLPQDPHPLQLGVRSPSLPADGVTKDPEKDSNVTYRPIFGGGVY